MRLSFACAVAIAAATPAVAEVTLADHGFVTSNSAEVSATPDEVWAALIEPSRYWNGDHSWSGDAANFSLEAWMASSAIRSASFTRPDKALA